MAYNPATGQDDPNYDPGAANSAANQAVGQSNPYGAFSGAITNAFQQYLGRAPSAQDISSFSSNQYGNYLNTPNWTAMRTQEIATSPEAQQYAQSQANQKTPTVQQKAQTATPTTPPSSPMAPSSGSPWGFDLLNLPAAPQPYQYQQGAIPQTALPTYTAAQIGQFGGNPLVYTPQVIQNLKAQAMDSNAAQQQAQLQAAQQSAAARNTLMGGSEGATEANIRSAAAGQLGQQYGNIDLNSALQNWQSQLQAYNAQLAGQQAQAQQGQAQYQSQADAQRYALEAAIAQEQAKQAGSQSALQNYGAQVGANMGWNEFLNQMLMQRGQLGLSYDQLALANQAAGLNSALGG